MATLHLVPVIDEGLGNSTYRLDIGRVLNGGAADWAREAGRSLETGR